jgi:hypothetical protein
MTRQIHDIISYLCTSTWQEMGCDLLDPVHPVPSLLRRTSRARMSLQHRFIEHRGSLMVQVKVLPPIIDIRDVAGLPSAMDAVALRLVPVG